MVKKGVQWPHDLQKLEPRPIKSEQANVGERKHQKWAYTYFAQKAYLIIQEEGPQTRIMAATFARNHNTRAVPPRARRGVERGATATKNMQFDTSDTRVKSQKNRAVTLLEKFGGVHKPRAMEAKHRTSNPRGRAKYTPVF